MDQIGKDEDFIEQMPLESSKCATTFCQNETASILASPAADGPFRKTADHCTGTGAKRPQESIPGPDKHLFPLQEFRLKLAKVGEDAGMARTLQMGVAPE